MDCNFLAPLTTFDRLTEINFLTNNDDFSICLMPFLLLFPNPPDPIRLSYDVNEFLLVVLSALSGAWFQQQLWFLSINAVFVASQSHKEKREFSGSSPILEVCGTGVSAFSFWTPYEEDHPPSPQGQTFPLANIDATYTIYSRRTKGSFLLYHCITIVNYVNTANVNLYINGITLLKKRVVSQFDLNTTFSLSCFALILTTYFHLTFVGSGILKANFLYCKHGIYLL